jgi:hypothetical protein
MLRLRIDLLARGDPHQAVGGFSTVTQTVLGSAARPWGLPPVGTETVVSRVTGSTFATTIREVGMTQRAASPAATW